MALTTDQKFAVASALAKLERDGLIAAGRSTNWLANQTPRPIARGFRAPAATEEVARLKKKVNRLVRASNASLVSLTTLIGTTTDSATKRTLAKAIDALSV